MDRVLPNMFWSFKTKCKMNREEKVNEEIFP